jgi:hypothetical protein
VKCSTVRALEVKLPGLDAPAAGARKRLYGLLPRNGHNKILLAFGEEQSMPGTATLECFLPPDKSHTKTVALASAGGLRAGSSSNASQAEASRRVGFRGRDGK